MASDFGAASTSSALGAEQSTSSGGDAVPKHVRPGERQYESEMMFIGQRCHWHECHREDFLPFRCPDCSHHFCSEHFRSEQHACPTPAPSFVVPLCPLCHEPPKQWKRDEDPNVAMDAHLSIDRRTGFIECPAIGKDGRMLTNKDGSVDKNMRSSVRTGRENECSERRCRKIMVVPIKCPSCSLHFCPSHRASVQHQCVSLTVGVPASKATTNKQSAGGRLLDTLAAKRAEQQASRADSNAAGDRSKAGDSQRKEITRQAQNLNPMKAISAVNQDRKLDKWVPPPIFGQA